MADKAKGTLTATQKKALIYSGMAVGGLALVYAFTMTTTPETKPVEAVSTSFTGGLDTRVVSLEGLNRRMADLESQTVSGNSEGRRELRTLQAQVDSLNRALEASGRTQQAALDRLAKGQAEQAAVDRARIEELQKELAAAKAQPGVPATPVAMSAAQPVQIQKPVDPDEERERRRRVIERQESIYTPAAPPPVVAQRDSSPARASVIHTFEGPEPEERARDERLDRIPDVNLPTGSILSAYLLTGVDAPTGTRAQSTPLPVLMRIKKEAILPNYALADVKDCHLLGAAYGDLASERVNIRGETVSCILADNTAVEGEVKFFVSGEDGKNGIQGNVVSRSGRLLAGAAGAAIAQGLMGALDDSSSSSFVLGSGATSTVGGAVSGAQEGFDLIAQYYIDLAEETFPVIEITNDRWVDVVLTGMLTIKWKG